MTVDTQQLTDLRKKLLDLSLKNNLLNYHESTARTIQISDKSIEDVYNNLIVNEIGMTFYPTDSTPVPADDKNSWTYPVFIKNDHNKDSVLDTPYNESELRKKLYALQSKSQTILEEQGYSILYIALGFIQWGDSGNAEKTLKAPLLLLPVELTHQKVKENYTLRWTGEDPVLSQSLIEKCKECGIVMPEFNVQDTHTPITTYIDAITQSISASGWTYLPQITLDLFSFKKLTMFKDLNPENWSTDEATADNTILQSIFSPHIQAENSISNHCGEMDMWLPSSDSYTILDADASQIDVIESAKRGSNLVVEGPPGTGKSQTIANLIAELLAAGKTVLFVSEKMAALEVVKRRLDYAGLSRFCLELHSQKAKKREFLNELTRTLHASEISVIYNENNAAYLDELKNHLNEYCDAISTPVGKSGYTVYELIGLREKYIPSFKRPELESFPIENVMEITYQENKRTLSILNDLVITLKKLVGDEGTLTNYPWLSTHPKLILPNELRTVQSLLSSYQRTYSALREYVETSAQQAGIQPPANDMELAVFEGILWCLANNIYPSLESMENPLWANPARISELINEVLTLYNERTGVLTHFTADIFAHDLSGDYRKLKNYLTKSVGWRNLSSDYIKFKEELAQWYLGDITNDEMLLSDLESAKAYGDNLIVIRKKQAVYQSVFGSAWTQDIPHPDVLIAYARFVTAIRKQKKYTCRYIAEIENVESDISDVYAKLSKLSTSLAKTKDTLNSHLNIDEQILHTSLSDFSSHVQIWIDEIGKLSDWSRFLSHTVLCEATPASGLLPKIFSGEISPDAILPTYVLSYVDLLLGEAYGASSSLSTFSQATHEEKIREFSDGDKKLVSANPARVCSILEAKIPNLDLGNTGDPEVNILLGEFNRKSGHLSIRTLMTQAGSLIQKIKPCFMMSPLSVAQYLDLTSIKFDVVIFDEASQVKPEDALGAIMRGRQLIVMGDSNQLPPTSFFDQMTDSDNPDELVAGISDMESLLHLCRKVYPVKRLRWHYRSRHESLIALSNQEFYDGNMFIFPSPKYGTDEFGLSFVYLEDAPYGRGESGTNIVEAREVAKAVISHYTQHPDKSIGVATFSTRQQEAIRREVEYLLRDNADIERYMYPENGEKFFVKNLETIQGDERDTILISIGYGRDKDGKLSRSFGPLNVDGGQRRLNVLITRAREKCVVYANFRGYELQADEHSAAGIRALADFLTYAETRSLSNCIRKRPVNDDEDCFADMLASFLEENGYQTMRKVGCADFRVDVAILNQDKPGEYLAGILCDGKNYCGTKVARDRERLRLQNLERLGWNIICIWSAEWYQNPDVCMNALLSDLSNLKQKYST